MVKNKIQIEVRYNDSIIHLGNKIDLIGKVHDKIYDFTELKEMLIYMLYNTYIMVNGQTFRQLIGIPMGTNSGVNVANLYLVDYEFDFIERLIIDKRYEIIDKFKNTIRFLDDILSIDNQLFKELLYSDSIYQGIHGIYPKEAVELQLVAQGLPLSYMDLLIKCRKNNHFLAGRLCTQSFDKRAEKKFSKIACIKYPHASSLLTDKMGYNVVLTECYRHYRLNTEAEGFLHEIAKVVQELRKKGFDLAKLLRTFRSFLLKVNNRALYGSESNLNLLDRLKVLLGVKVFKHLKHRKRSFSEM